MLFKNLMVLIQQLLEDKVEVELEDFLELLELTVLVVVVVALYLLVAQVL